MTRNPRQDFEPNPTPVSASGPVVQIGGRLTRRELEIARLVARGYGNREIAEELMIAASTAERHIANILSKLGARSRTQIAVWAVERGLLYTSVDVGNLARVLPVTRRSEERRVGKGWRRRGAR